MFAKLWRSLRADELVAAGSAPMAARRYLRTKAVAAERNGNILSLEQSLEEPFGYCNSTEYLGEVQGVVVQDNDPEDICSAVVEMLDRVAGHESYDENDAAMRERAESIYASAAIGCIVFRAFGSRRLRGIFAPTFGAAHDVSQACYDVARTGQAAMEGEVSR